MKMFFSDSCAREQCVIYFDRQKSATGKLEEGKLIVDTDVRVLRVKGKNKARFLGIAAFTKVNLVYEIT